MPKIILVHLSPDCEKEIKKEALDISKELDHPIELAYEGLTLSV